MKVLMWVMLLFITTYSQQYVVIDSVNEALSIARGAEALLPTVNKSAYDVIEAALVDTFTVLWADDVMIIDSIKCVSDDSVTIQIKIVGDATTNVFASAQLINGSSTLTSFQDDNLASDEKAYLYFTLIGDTLTRLQLKIYWRYL